VAESIDFGVLLTPNTMIVKRTRHSTPHGQVKLVLDLRRREIVIRFPSSYADKIREYKFVIPIDQVFDLFQSHSETGTTTSFILTLQNPPHFYKKLSDGIKSTHEDAALQWREEDAWLRQTNILSYEHEITQVRGLPVTLKNHPEGIVNIGRWTTYRITVDDGNIDKEKYRIFKAALKDYNVQIAKVDDFHLEHEHDPAWDLLDSSLSEYLSPSAAPSGQATFSHSLQGLFDSKKNEIFLPFEVRYQLEVCISNGWINEHNITRQFLQTLATTHQERAKHILEVVAQQEVRMFDPMDIFQLRIPRLPSMKSSVPQNCVLIRSVIITPSTMMLNTPYVEMTNRVIRKFQNWSDYFLRVRFEDDESRGYARISATSQKTMDEILSKVFRTLTSGITLGDRHYDFLAFGNSQLREHGAYFFAKPPAGPSASNIRAWMGRFQHERIVAKHAARIGQCFSTTRAVRNAGFPAVKKAELMDDLERNGFNFTDGVGKIGPFYAQTVARELGLRTHVPSVYQFRMAGCKGVLAIAPELGATFVKLRKSQFKFETDYSGMEIIRWSEYWVATLNRQLILVMSALGVSDEIFLEMQEKEIQLMERAMINDSAAVEALTGHVDPNRMTLTIAGLVQAGFRQSHEPFVTSLLHLWRAWSIKYLKEKAKLPVREGACILGCTDETGTLRGHFDADPADESDDLESKIAKLPEVFVQITCPDSGKRRVIEGLCTIARNPSLHAGDIRVVRAINVPALHHLVDCLVLPQTGDRDLSSMCSGGDLDGDDYIVIWDERLLPKIWNAEPMDYTPPPPAPLQRDVTQTDITRFFVKYMKNDFLPRIALAHLAWADFLDDGIRNEKCLELALLHSKAVDYPKTGQPAQMPKALNAKSWPHFMEKKHSKMYRSHKVLGQLYDAVDRVAFEANYDAPFDERILNACDPSEEIMESARELKHEYDQALQRIMAQHDIKTEFEVWSTFVLDHSKASKDYKFHEEIGQLSNSIKEQYHNAVVDKAGGRTWNHLVPWAVAMYRLTKEELNDAKLQRSGSTMPFISFPWLLRSTLTQIAKGVESKARAGGDVAGTSLEHIQQAAVNPLTQIYDDPYQPGSHEEKEGFHADPLSPQTGVAGNTVLGNSLGEDSMHPQEEAPSNDLRPKKSHVRDETVTIQSDPHHLDNNDFPAGSYPRDLSIPPLPTNEQSDAIQKIIRQSVSVESSSGRSGGHQASMMNSPEPIFEPSFGFSRNSVNNSRQSSQQVDVNQVAEDLLGNLDAESHIDVSEHDSSSRSGSGVLVDMTQLDLNDHNAHSTKGSISLSRSAELAGLNLETLETLVPSLEEFRNDSALIRDQVGGNHNDVMDDLLDDTSTVVGEMAGVLQSTIAPLTQKTSNVANGTAGKNIHNTGKRKPSLIDDLDEDGDEDLLVDPLQSTNKMAHRKTHNPSKNNLIDDQDPTQLETDAEDEDDDEDGEVIMVDPVQTTIGGAETDADRLLKLGGL
jgi:RNA-dependent RNA polymerase